MIVDKIDAHQAFDLDSDLLELGGKEGLQNEKVIWKTIFTTNLKGNDESNQLIDAD